MTDLLERTAVERLKPCPFCGGDNAVIRSNSIGDFYVLCYSDDLSEIACGASTSDRSCETEQGAATRWNRRADASELERLQALVGRLEGALRPFAEMADRFIYLKAEDWVYLHTAKGAANSPGDPNTVADFRAARQALLVEGGG